MRDAATAVERAKRTLALAIAQVSRRGGVLTPPMPHRDLEIRRHRRTRRRPEDLARRLPSRSPRWRRTAMPP